MGEDPDFQNGSISIKEARLKIQRHFVQLRCRKCAREKELANASPQSSQVLSPNQSFSPQPNSEMQTHFSSQSPPQQNITKESNDNFDIENDAEDEREVFFKKVYFNQY